MFQASQNQLRRDKAHAEELASLRAEIGAISGKQSGIHGGAPSQHQELGTGGGSGAQAPDTGAGGGVATGAGDQASGGADGTAEGKKP
jgi:hypothetical protein